MVQSKYLRRRRGCRESPEILNRHGGNGMHHMTVTKEERSYLRDLAKKQMEYARLPVMQERLKRWQAVSIIREMTGSGRE